MPEIVIRLTVPEGCTVRVETPQGSTTGRGAGRGGGSAPATNGAPRGGGGARGEGDGSASEKQRKLVFARAKAAGMDLAALLATVGLDSLDSAGWKDINAMVEILATGELPPAPQGEGPIDDSDIPF